MVLHGICFSIEAGDRVVISGPSGSGKSLLLRAVAQLDPIDQGDVLWKGGPVQPAKVPAFRREVAERRRLRVPIGSGITEAACKIVFSQRFKCAGMKWGVKTGASILAMRVIALSGIWSETRDAMFESHNNTHPSTPRQFQNEKDKFDRKP
jgi:energy-coupling factor transporter ATP-binding protein EcfA2